MLSEELIKFTTNFQKRLGEIKESEVDKSILKNNTKFLMKD